MRTSTKICFAIFHYNVVPLESKQLLDSLSVVLVVVFTIMAAVSVLRQDVVHDVPYLFLLSIISRIDYHFNYMYCFLHPFSWSAF